MSKLYKRRYQKFILFSTIPVIVLYVIFMIFPIAQSLYYSLFHWSGFSAGMEYVGLENYTEMWGDQNYLTVVWNSLKYVVIGGILIVGITLLFTYAISNYKNRRWKQFIQMILFVPNAISPVALGMAWTFLLDPNWGLVNSLLNKMGLGFLASGWLSDDLIFSSAMAMLVWIHVGFFIVTYVAAVDRIPNSLYESAQIDGATPWQQFSKITYPLIKNIIETSMVIWTIFAFKIFGYLYTFGVGGGSSVPSLAVRNLSVHLFLMGFGKRTSINRLGYASGMGIMLLVMVAILVLIIRRLFKSAEVYEF